VVGATPQPEQGQHQHQHQQACGGGVHWKAEVQVLEEDSSATTPLTAEAQEVRPMNKYASMPHRSARVAPAAKGSTRHSIALGAKPASRRSSRRASLGAALFSALDLDQLGGGAGPSELEEVISLFPHLRRPTVKIDVSKPEQYTAENIQAMVASLMDVLQNADASAEVAVQAWAVAHGLMAPPEDCTHMVAKLSSQVSVHGQLATIEVPESLPTPVVLAIVQSISEDVKGLKKLARWGLAIRMSSALAISYADLISDGLIVLEFSANPELAMWANWTLASIARL